MQVDEESFTAEISRIKKLEIFGFESVDGIATISGFIGIEPGGDGFNMVDPHGKGENEDSSEDDPCRDMVGTKGETFAHKQYYFFVFYGRIIARISKKEKLGWVFLSSAANCWIRG